MCLVQGCIFRVRASSKAPEFSSNARQWTSVEVESIGKSFAFISLSSCIMEIVLRSDCDNVMYSAYVVENIIYVCSLLKQMIGQPAYRMA